MLSLPKHLYRESNYLLLRKRCFDRLSITFFFTAWVNRPKAD